MAAIERTDFSGGMVTDVSELKSPDNTVRTAQNVDLWSKKGSAKLIDSFVNIDNFPAGKSYDHHVIFPVQGDKDYAVIMMTDGTIYPYEPSGGFGSLLTTVTAGARMAYAGESVYVFYRAMSNPSLANTVRKRIYWDYDTSAWVVENIFVDEHLTIDSAFKSSSGATGNYYWFKAVLTSVNGDGGESKGIAHFNLNDNSNDRYLYVKRDVNFNKARLYMSHIGDADGDGVKDTPFTSPLFIFEINGGSDKSYVPFLSGRLQVENSTPALRAYEKWNGTLSQDTLARICDQYVNHSKTYIDVGNKVKIEGEEYEIQSITYNSSDPNNTYFQVELDGTPPNIINELAGIEGEDYSIIEVELGWDNDLFVVPLQARYQDIGGVPVDENRPESLFTSGTGNILAFSSNKLFTANPYFPDVFNTGKDDDFKGFIAWNWITGEGKHAFSLIPDTQLISPTFTGSKIVDMFAFQDTLFILMNSGIARLKFENNNITFLQNDKYGVASRNKYYVDLGNMFIFSGGRLYAGAIDKLNYETGAFDFAELGRFISSLLETLTDPRITYDNVREIIYVCDVSDGTVYICSLRDEKPAWVGLVFTTTYKIYSGFKLNDTFYFVTYVSGGYRISQNGGSLNSNVVIEDKDVYIPMGKDFVRKIEVLYVKPSGTLTFTPILDDVALSGQSLPNKSNVGFYEIKLSRSGETRFNKFRWKLEGSSLTSAFKFLGVFVNRDVYTRETQKGY